MKKTTIARRKLTQECWNLDQAWLAWLKEHLPVYLRDARRMIDFTYKKFTHRGVEYQQDQLVERMIQLVDKAIADNLIGDEYQAAVDELLEIWKLVFYDMWW